MRFVSKNLCNESVLFMVGRARNMGGPRVRMFAVGRVLVRTAAESVHVAAHVCKAVYNKHKANGQDSLLKAVRLMTLFAAGDGKCTYDTCCLPAPDKRTIPEQLAQPHIRQTQTRESVA